MHCRYEVTGRRIPRTSTSIPSFTCGTAHDIAEYVQTECTRQHQSETLHPDGPPSKRTRSKCPLPKANRLDTSITLGTPDAAATPNYPFYNPTNPH